VAVKEFVVLLESQAGAFTGSIETMGAPTGTLSPFARQKNALSLSERRH